MELQRMSEDNNGGAPPAVPAGKTFSQAELDQILEGRLQREREKYEDQLRSKDLDLDNIKREARMHIAAAQGKTLPNDFVAHEVAQVERDTERKAQLALIFGNTAGASLRAQKLFREDAVEYRRLRSEWQILNGVRNPEPTPQLARSFRP